MRIVTVAAAVVTLAVVAWPLSQALMLLPVGPIPVTVVAALAGGAVVFGAIAVSGWFERRAAKG